MSTDRSRSRESDCRKKPAKGSGSVSLPVLPAANPKPARPHSTMGRWRAGVLIFIHLLILAHAAQWLLSGEAGERKTLSPIEPSEAMQTLEGGLVNAGFVMFALAILATLIFGRFFCGWGCHVVALQDLSGWIMKKCGVHPKPWRSRLLVWAPLLLALYMFVWPTFRREILAPLIGVEQKFGSRVVHTLTDAQAAWLGQAFPFPAQGLQKHFIVEDFWASFPPWYVGVPFVLLIGFVIVYFLGAKGFCTYGCPYGGFFFPSDRLAPVRIRVTDDCEHCGHCTAVCTSNVRVHEEVRDFGMVVDPGCMKCLDCVSACPNDALYVGLGRPALLAPGRSPPDVRRDAAQKRAARWDLTWPEEIGLGLVFFVLLNAYRGMYGYIPLLMAVAAAGVVTFMTHKAWRLLRDQSVRAPHSQLKVKGRVTTLGWGFVLVTLAALLLAAQGLTLRICEWVGGGYDGFIKVPSDRVFARDYKPTPDDLRRARTALAWFGRASGFADGGLGFFSSIGVNERMSWLAAVAGDLPQAEARLRAVLAQRQPQPALVLDLVSMRLLQGDDPDRIPETIRPWLGRWPGLARFSPPAESVLDVARLAATSARGVGGVRVALAAVRASWPGIKAEPGNVNDVFDIARDLDQLGRPIPEIHEVFAAVLEVYPNLEGVRKAWAMDLVRDRTPDAAMALYREALAKHPTDPEIAFNAGELHLALQDPAGAIEAMEPAVKAPTATDGLVDLYATALYMAGRSVDAEAALRRAIAMVPTQGRYQKLAELLTELGRPAEAREAQNRAAAMAKSAGMAPSGPPR